MNETVQPPLPTGKRANLYGRLPLNAWRVVCSLFSAAVYLSQLFTAVVLGYLLFSFGKKTERKRLFFHRYILFHYRFDLRHLPGVSYRLNNPHGETFERPSVIICNHQSFLDSVTMMVLSPKILIVTSGFVWKNKIIHKILGFADYYPVTQGIEHSVDFFRPFVDKGYHIVVFPEGEISADCSVGRFHRGAFYLAEQLGVDILPVFNHGVGHVVPKGVFWLNRGQITTEIGRRVASADMTFGTNYSERAKNIGHRYRECYAEICRRIECAAYFRHLVVGLYGCIDRSAKRRVRRLLDANDNFSACVDPPLSGETLAVFGDSTGCAALLFALVHPHVRIVSVEAADWLCLLASKCGRLPENLTFRSGEEPLNYDKYPSVTIPE